MSITSAIVTFVIIWWLVFFTVLPFGVRKSEPAPGSGHDPGAPARPYLWRKAAVTTVIAIILLLLWWWVTRSGVISLR